MHGVCQNSEKEGHVGHTASHHDLTKHGQPKPGLGDARGHVWLHDLTKGLFGTALPGRAPASCYSNKHCAPL